MFNKFSKRSGIYHIQRKDNIQCLELRIQFRHVNTLLKLPKFDYNKNISTEYWNSYQYEETENENNEEEKNQQRLERSNEKKLEQVSEGDDNLRVVHIKWQQKLLSPEEQERYKDLKNCVTDAQKQYHEWILATLAAEEEANAEAGDRRSSKKRKKKRGKKQARGQSNELEIMEQQMPESKLKTCEIFTYVNEDGFKPPDVVELTSLKTTNHLQDGDVEHMYVYAAIKPDTQLVHLQWHKKQRLLHIYPDFNDFSEHPYFIELDTDYRHLYAYGIENVSFTRQAETSAGPRLADLLQLTPSTAHWQTEAELSKHFSMPPKRTRRVSLLLEIRKVEDFLRDALHIRYSIQLPANTIHEEGLLEASTSTALRSRLNNDCHFGNNWQITLLCDEMYDPAEPLRIYFEVISIDSWQRERIEGYGYQALHLDQSNSCQHYSIHCLRPVDTFWDSLNRLFIGGRCHFDYKRFFNKNLENSENSALEGGETVSFHSRYGCRMQQTGQIIFSCQIMTQRNCELLQPCSSRLSGMTLDDIMSAYKEARNRLEALVL